VSEATIGDILQRIGRPANLRSERREGDIEGDYDRWFDGGAVKHTTGVSEFILDDGSRASVAVTPLLSIEIHLTDGRRVHVRQAG
jgi:hypothetical protein